MCYYEFKGEIYDGTKFTEKTTISEFEETYARFDADVDLVWWDYEEIDAPVREETQ